MLHKKISLVVFFFCALSLITSCNSTVTNQTNNTAIIATTSPSDEAMIDDKLDKLMQELAIAQADKACVEDSMTDEKCKEIKAKLVSDSDMERLEFIGNLNKKCRDFNYTDEQCRKYKETFVKKFRVDIDAEIPFSDLNPKLKASIDEVTKKMCANMSAEKCKKGKWAMLRMAQDRYKEIKKTVADECEKRNAPTDKCKEIETRMLEGYNKDIMSKAELLLKQLS